MSFFDRFRDAGPKELARIGHSPAYEATAARCPNLLNPTWDVQGTEAACISTLLKADIALKYSRNPSRICVLWLG